MNVQWESFKATVRSSPVFTFVVLPERSATSTKRLKNGHFWVIFGGVKKGHFWGKKGPFLAFFQSRLFPYYLPVDFRVFGGEMWRSKAGPPKKGSLLTFLAFFSLLFARRFSPYYLPVVFVIFRGGVEKRGGDGSKRVKKGQKRSKKVKKGPLGPKKGVFP